MINPITDLSGPQFFVFYVGFVIVSALLSRWLAVRGDPTRHLLPLPIPDRVDPYEVACLRGGDKELARVVVVRLMELGYLRLVTRRTSEWPGWGMERYIVQQAPPAESGRLEALERCVFDWFRGERRIDQVFADDGLAVLLNAHAVRYEERLHAERLLTGNRQGLGASFARGIVSPTIVGIGVAKAIAGLLGGQSFQSAVVPVLFMTWAGACLVSGASQPDRLSHRGKAYLKALQQKWAPLRSTPVGSGSPVALAAGLFGIAVLSGTEYGTLADAFRKAQSSGDGLSVEGCGDGCGDCGA